MSEYFRMPCIEVETNAGIREVALETRHLMNRRIFLYGNIDGEAANRTVSQLLYLNESGTEPIRLYINSEGGDANAVLLLYDVLQSLTVPLDTCCMGRAFGMAVILLAGAPKGRRRLFPHSQTSLYKPVSGSGVDGFAGGSRDRMANSEKVRAVFVEILEKHTGRSREEIEKAMAGERPMDAGESIAFGICDEVCGGLT